MNNSETSDEVILTGTRPKHMRQPKALQPPTFQEAPEVPIVHISREKKKKPMPVKTQTRQMEATPEIKEELRRLTEEIRGGIGNRKAKTEDEMGTNAAALKSARSGPGVDPDSEVYQRIASRSKVDRANEKRFEFPEGLPDEKTRKLQWILYKDDTRAYPEIQSGRVVFNEHPPARQSTIPAPGCVFGELPPCPTTEEIIKSVNWRNWEATNKRIVDEGSEHANWRFNRSSYEPDEGFSKWLFSWLDSTMHMCHYVDIYHRAFFDGIAHPDGMQDMFIPHFKYVEAISPPEDDETKLHAYEIVDGYRWNYMNNKALKNRATKNDSRAQYLSSMRSPASPAPISPKANIYLRAAANGDISELSLLYNWYVHNSPQCVDLNPVDDAAMRQRIQHSRTDQLPFVVAAERQTGKATRSNRVRNERLLGFVSLTDFMGVDTIGERTAEVKIFVHPGNKGKGVGRCLMDKVMELCDPSYSSRGGYFFESGKLSYRSLGFLIIAMSYPQHEPAEYHRVKEWLQKAHQFEEQGLLKGVARKGSKQ
jgi:L-amino acid N-acyltransferase YncA